jgi:hypothetical protein
MGTENLVPTGIRTPDRPLCNRRLAQLETTDDAEKVNVFVSFSTLPWPTVCVAAAC